MTSTDMDAATPLIEKVAPLPVPQFVLDDRLYSGMAETASLESDIVQPLPSWTIAEKRPSGHKLPQTIAHRGFKANHPENTMGAFKGAAQVGSHAIETDIHLTKDDVVVLSHDATLKRCFGVEEKIIDCDWDFIQQQRTLHVPHERMPSLADLLKFLALSEQAHMWLLLDIKLDNDADTVMRLIAQTIQSISPSSSTPWNKRVVLGCWAAKYLPLCAKYLPTFPITHIGFSVPYANQFFSVPNISFNMLQQTLIMPFAGRRFLRRAREEKRPVYAWTVNKTNMMRWCIDRKLDAVITDDPKKFMEVCDAWEDGKRNIDISWKEYLMILWVNLMVIFFGTLMWWKYGGMKQLRKQEKQTRALRELQRRHG